MTSASPVVTNTAVGGTLAGIVAMLASLGASFTGHGFNLADALGALSGAGISASSLGALVFHHSAVLRHDAAIAISAKPDLDELRADVDDEKATSERILNEVAPRLEAKIQEVDVAWHEGVTDALGKVGVTPDVEAAAERAVRKFLVVGAGVDTGSATSAVAGAAGTGPTAVAT